MAESDILSRQVYVHGSTMLARPTSPKAPPPRQSYTRADKINQRVVNNPNIRLEKNVSVSYCLGGSHLVDRILNPRMLSDNTHTHTHTIQNQLLAVITCHFCLQVPASRSSLFSLPFTCLCSPVFLNSFPLCSVSLYRHGNKSQKALWHEP